MQVCVASNVELLSTAANNFFTRALCQSSKQRGSGKVKDAWHAALSHGACQQRLDAEQCWENFNLKFQSAVSYKNSTQYTVHNCTLTHLHVNDRCGIFSGVKVPVVACGAGKCVIGQRVCGGQPCCYIFVNVSSPSHQHVKQCHGTNNLQLLLRFAGPPQFPLQSMTSSRSA